MISLKVGDIVKMKMLHKGKVLQHYPRPMIITEISNFYHKPAYLRCKYIHSRQHKAKDVSIDEVELMWVDQDYAKLVRMFLL